jgi:hypothetical protein
MDWPAWGGKKITTFAVLLRTLLDLIIVSAPRDYTISVSFPSLSGILTIDWFTETFASYKAQPQRCQLVRLGAFSSLSRMDTVR